MYFRWIALLLLVCACHPFSKAKLSEEDNQKQKIESGYFGEGKPLFLVSSACDQTKQKILVFIHGSPGSWSDYKKYLNHPDLQKEFCVIAVDRPGFGNSPTDQSFPNIFEQSKLIGEALFSFFAKKEIKVYRLTLVGHSYGGPIVLAKGKWKDKIEKLILLASPADPLLEEIHWYNKFGSITFVQWILPNSLNHSNEEMYSLPSQLKELDEQLAILESDLTIVHGTEDALVPFQNVKYLKEHSPRSKVIIYALNDEGHFIPWTKFDLILDILLQRSKLSPSI